jgi:asparagine synthase (glutamine-hydrolysing)
MCGIAGGRAFAPSFRVDPAAIGPMCDAIEHRGPNGAGVEHFPRHGVGLGHRRLAIIDLSPAGRNPMSNEDGTVWITFNGEIYNHAALRADLERRGHVYRSRTDTETVLHLYEEEGPRCVERLEGMFAFAIWDARRDELFLARDRLGVKPLYVTRQPGGFLFGSEAKALLAHPAVRAELDEAAFHDYLTFAFSPPPRTLFAGIEKLAPAQRMTVRADGTVVQDTYWTPLNGARIAEVRAMSEDEQVDELRGLLRESIGQRMMSDVPYGVFLSGGVDSSANVALMAEQSSAPVRTFSTAPKGHAKYDELSYARLVAERFGTDHHEIVIDEADLAGFLPELVEFQDEPTADWTAIPQHFVTKLARDSGTIVVQVGEGADELFHGYKGYADHRRFVVPFQRWVPPVLRRPAGRAALGVTSRTGRGIRHGEALYDAAHSPQPYWGGALCFRGPGKDRIAPRSRLHRPWSDVVERVWREGRATCPDADLFQLMSYLELKQRLSELLLMRLDKITMLSSVEGRDPFLAPRLVEFALALPPSMKHRDGVGKYALKRAMRGLLPDAVLDRPKQGFGTPMAEWLRGEFGREARAQVRGSSLADRGLLDYDEIDRLFAAHAAGRADFSYHLFNLYSISVWHDRWIAGARKKPDLRRVA